MSVDLWCIRSLIFWSYIFSRSGIIFTKLEVGKPIHSWPWCFTADTLRDAMTLTFSTHWPWTFVVYRLSCSNSVPNFSKIRQP